MKKMLLQEVLFDREFTCTQNSLKLFSAAAAAA